MHLSVLQRRHRNTSVGAHLHDGEEDLEGDSVVGSVFHHQLFHLAFSRVLIKQYNASLSNCANLAQRPHDISNLADWDLSVTTLVVQQKRLLRVFIQIYPI